MGKSSLIPGSQLLLPFQGFTRRAFFSRVLRRHSSSPANGASPALRPPKPNSLWPLCCCCLLALHPGLERRHPAWRAPALPEILLRRHLAQQPGHSLRLPRHEGEPALGVPPGKARLPLAPSICRLDVSESEFLWKHAIWVSTVAGHLDPTFRPAAKARGRQSVQEGAFALGLHDVSLLPGVCPPPSVRTGNVFSQSTGTRGASVTQTPPEGETLGP